MALAPFFRRSAVAAAQVLAGYDEAAIAQRLEDHTVALTLTDGALSCPEGAALADLTTRLLARLYPRLAVPPELEALVRQINPDAELTQRDADVAIAVGAAAAPTAPVTVYAGSDGWIGRAGTAGPYALGSTANPFGPGVAACLACANVFRAVFGLGDLDEDAGLAAAPEGTELPAGVDLGEVVLVGSGAVGTAAAWALGRAPVTGRVHLVDHETLELGNLQRYVLTTLEDVGHPKVDVLAAAAPFVAHEETWAAFCDGHGHRWPRVLVAVDSARARREVQASLPRWIANAWTQPGDLGVSVHPWTDTGACLNCLYLPTGLTPSDDVVVARALGIEPEAAEVRRLLFQAAAAPPDMLERIAEALNLDRAAVAPYAHRPLRALYTEGVCGGAVLPLDRAGRPAADAHVPLAHQSALAGVLLAAAGVADALGCSPASTMILRLDVLHAVPPSPMHPAAKDPRGICICQDPVYREAWEQKWVE
jgi:ThiF family